MISSAHSASASGSAGRGGSIGTAATAAARHVARQLDIDRQRTLARAAQHARDLARRLRGIGEHGLVAGDLAKDRKLRVDRARLVMQHEAARALARAWRARDDDDRRALRVGARDGIDEVEGPGPEGHDRDAEARVIARRRVGREAHAGLMAQRVVRQDPALLDHLEERQHEVARNAEDLARAVVLEALQQRYRQCGHREFSRPDARGTRPTT